MSLRKWLIDISLITQNVKKNPRSHEKVTAAQIVWKTVVQYPVHILLLPYT